MLINRTWKWRLMLPLLWVATALTPSVSVAALSDIDAIFVRGFSQSDSVADLGPRLDKGFLYDVQLHVDYVSPNYGESGGGRDLYEYLRGAPDQAAQWPVKCQDACVILSLSTGDLVTRVFLENQADWAAEDGIEPFNIVATIDLVGAGGGTEAANWWLVAPPETREAWQNALRDLGIDPPDIPFGDTVEDLRPGRARTIATRFREHRVPRFRVSVRPDVAGHMPLGYINVRAHDLLVPAHSSCGVNDSVVLLGSCVDNVGYSGVTHDLGIELNHAGPSDFGRALWPYHYPIIMGSGFWHHFNAGEAASEGHLTYVERQPEAMGVGFDFNINGYAQDTTYYGLPYPEFYNCRWTWTGYKCDTRWVSPIIYRRQHLNQGGSIVDVISNTFFRR